MAFATATAVVGVLAAPGIAPVANSFGSPSPFLSWHQLMDIQGKMNETASAVEQVSGQIGSQALAGVVAAPETKHLTIYWHGELAPEVRAVVAHSPVRVDVKSAPHSAQDLKDASREVTRIADSVGVRITDVAMPQDGSGLTATVVGGEADAQRLRRAVASVSVPVTVEANGTESISLGEPSRRSDPSAGGAQIIAPFCSTAFAIKYRDENAMLTADHCFMPNNETNVRYGVDDSGGQGPAIGTRISPHIVRQDERGPVYLDAAVIKPSSNITMDQQIWTGGAADQSSISQTKKWVSAAQVAHEGNWICNEGSRSGEICNIQVTTKVTDYYAKGPDNLGGEIEHHYMYGWKALKQFTAADNSSIAARRGDSGGPVVLGGGPGLPGAPPNITALGIVSATTGGTWSCKTPGKTMATTCSGGIMFVGLEDALPMLGAKIGVRDWSTGHVSWEDYGSGGGGVAMGSDPKPHDHTELVDGNGAAMAYDLPSGRLVGSQPGDPRADWEILQTTDGGWMFRNLAAPNEYLGQSADVGLQMSDWEGGHWYFHLQIKGGNCLALWPGASVPNSIATPGNAPCDHNDENQLFKLVPVGDEDADLPSTPGPPPADSLHLPSQQPPVKPSGPSVDAAYSFLAQRLDAHGTGSTLRVPRSYQGGHFEDPKLFGPDGFQASFTYDNALVITAFLQRGGTDDVAHATALGDSLLYAQAHDITPDGRIRASYEPDPFVKTPSGEPYVGGFSVYTGNMAWAGMALTRLYQVTGQQRFLDGALKAANWIQNNTADTRGAGGYTGGLRNDDGTGQTMVPLTWKATEHNIDTGAFFAMLAGVTGDAGWAQRSTNAFRFVKSVQAANGHLWTGTGLDGVTTNDDVEPEDVQTWSYLATLDPSYAPAVDWAAGRMAATDGPYSGVGFSGKDTSGVWFEGTAHLLAAYQVRRADGDAAKAATLMATLQKAQSGAANTDGKGIVAASHDGLDTGEGDFYYSSLHTGATAWYVIAAQGGNPFRL
ncbi:trypsin-like serine protease [Kitasatospora sp. NPDC127121]|uniref:trypsin-like serine protease n=1 Tax=Kitasatospora sp. NPDC127121 TaxID=3345371 RepID=UPI00362FCCB4